MGESGLKIRVVDLKLIFLHVFLNLNIRYWFSLRSVF